MSSSDQALDRATGEPHVTLTEAHHQGQLTDDYLPTTILTPFSHTYKRIDRSFIEPTA